MFDTIISNTKSLLQQRCKQTFVKEGNGKEGKGAYARGNKESGGFSKAV